MKGSLTSILIGCFFILFGSYQISGQGKDFKLNEKLPIDKDLRYGELKNGLKYYLIRNTNSKGRLCLYFLVKVGDENETKDQLEFSHLLEHVALNGTRDFPDIRAFLGQRGIVWGLDFNGTTSAKSTVYRFSIPDGNRELLADCLSIIRNWANGEVSIDSARVHVEKGAVQQELSMYVGEFSRMRKEFYADVIGIENHNGRILVDTRMMLEESEPSQLMRFYHDWYVPSREALVILGDFDVDSMEQRVRDRFGNLTVKPGKRGKLASPYFSPLKLNGRNGVFRIKKNEKRLIESKIVLKSAYRPIVTFGDLKEDLIRTLLAYLIDFRCRHANRIGDNQGYSVHYDRVLSEFGKPFSSLVLDFQCDSAQLESGYTGLIEEFYRISRLGFSEEEIDRAKGRLKADFGHSFMDEVGLKMSDCMDNFMRGEAIPAPETRRRLVFAILDSLVVEDISRVLKEWPLTQNRDVVFFVPRTYRAELVSTETVKEWDQQAERSPLRPFQYVPNEKPRQVVKKSFPPLMTSEQRAVLGNRFSPLTKNKIESVDGVSVTLDNGIKVIFKQVASDTDSVVYIKGLKRWDAVVHDRKDSLLEKYSPRLISASGLGEYNADEWVQYKMQNQIKISHDFQGNGVSILGRGHPNAVEGILQAIRLSIVNPKIDSVFIDQWKREQIEQIENSKGELSTPSVKYLSALSSKFDPWVLNNGSEVSDLRLESILERYKEMYCNDGDYIFFVIGKFNLDSVSLLLNKYIGTIPVVDRRRDAIFSGGRGNDFSLQRRIFYDSSLATSRIDVLFPVMMPENSCSNVAMQIIQDEFRRLVIDRLRTKEGISYAPTVSLNRVVGSKYLLSVFFDCANDRIDDGVRFVKEEFDRLRNIDMQHLLFDSSKKFVRSQIHQKASKTSFWSEYFVEIFFEGWNLDGLADCHTVVDDVTVESVFDMMRFFSPDQAMVFVLSPKDSSVN